MQCSLAGLHTPYHRSLFQFCVRQIVRSCGATLSWHILDSRQLLHGADAVAGAVFDATLKLRRLAVTIDPFDGDARPRATKGFIVRIYLDVDLVLMSVGTTRLTNTILRLRISSLT